MFNMYDQEVYLHDRQQELRREAERRRATDSLPHTALRKALAGALLALAARIAPAHREARPA